MDPVTFSANTKENRNTPLKDFTEIQMAMEGLTFSANTKVKRDTPLKDFTEIWMAMEGLSILANCKMSGFLLENEVRKLRMGLKR